MHGLYCQLTAQYQTDGLLAHTRRLKSRRRIARPPPTCGATDASRRAEQVSERGERKWVAGPLEVEGWRERGGEGTARF